MGRCEPDGARSIIRVYAMRHTTSVEFWIAMVMMLMLLVENSGREVGRRLLLVLLREVKDISGGRYLVVQQWGRTQRST